MKKSMILALVLGAVMGWVARTLYFSRQFQESSSGSSTPVYHGQTEHALRDDMRKLWTDHVMWTNSCILSAFAQAKDFDVLVQRLRTNKQELAALFGKYYGAEVQKKLGDLLTEHIMIALDLVRAAKEHK